MPRPKASEEQRTEIRKRIQNAAADIYRAEDISAISARSVATKAGVSVGTIYAHFGDLASLMRSLWTGHVERQDSKFRALAKSVKDPVERLKALLREYLIFGHDNPALYRGAFMFVRPESHDAPKAEPMETYSFPALLIETVHDGQITGQFRDGDPEIFAQILWSGLHGSLALPVNFDRLAVKPTKDLTCEVIDALLRIVATDISGQ